MRSYYPRRQKNWLRPWRQIRQGRAHLPYFEQQELDRPSTVRIEGGSVGFQIGGSSTDYVLLVLNKKGKGKLISSKFTLGADAAVAGGPVGRSAQAQTDVQMRAEILAYSRSRGAFAGISLEGATPRQDKNDNKDIYGKSVTPTEILYGDVAVPASVQILVDTLTKYSAFEH